MADTKPKSNTYDDDDFRQVLSEMEEMDDEAETIMASARGKVQSIRKRQKNRIKIAKQELQIPSDVLRAILKQRKLEIKLQRLTEDVSDDMIEVFDDAAGQFSLFATGEDEPEAVSPAQAAARKRKAEIAEVTAKEQADGAAALNELAGGGVH